MVCPLPPTLLPLQVLAAPADFAPALTLKLLRTIKHLCMGDAKHMDELQRAKAIPHLVALLKGDAPQFVGTGPGGNGGANGNGGGERTASLPSELEERRVNWKKLQAALGQLNRAGVEALAEPTRAQVRAVDSLGLAVPEGGSGAEEMAEMMARGGGESSFNLDAPPEGLPAAAAAGRARGPSSDAAAAGGGRTRMPAPRDSSEVEEEGDSALPTLAATPASERKSTVKNGGDGGPRTPKRRLSILRKGGDSSGSGAVGGRRPSTTTMPGKKTAAAWQSGRGNGIKASFFTWGRTKRSTERSVEPPPLVPLASTQVPFFEYIDACPQRLKDLGLFEFVRFDKWPHTAELQPTATAVALVRLQREKERRTEVAEEETKRSNSIREAFKLDPAGSIRSMCLGTGYPRVQPNS